jgi:hypothetical protein
MENESLTNLNSFIDEPLFLLPEDRRSLESELFGTDTLSKEAVVEKQIVNLPKEMDAASPVSSSTDFIPEPLTVQGNFTKGILILHEETELNAEVMDMLVKMLNACGHSMNEVGMLSSFNIQNRSMEDFQGLNAHVVLKFGRIKHPVNHLPFAIYEIHTEGETEYLFADALTTIAEDKLLKRNLWTALQLLFNLSTGTK